MVSWERTSGPAGGRMCGVALCASPGVRWSLLGRLCPPPRCLSARSDRSCVGGVKRLNEGLDRLVKGLLLGQFRHRGCQLQFPCQKRWVTVWEPGVGLSLRRLTEGEAGARLLSRGRGVCCAWSPAVSETLPLWALRPWCGAAPRPQDPGHPFRLSAAPTL